MSIGYVRALTILHQAFGSYPPAHRAHMLVRFFSCPFLRTIDAVPEGARVVEIGAGHGLFARLLAEERVREVIAVEPDVRKSLLPSPSAKIRKVAAFDDAIRGEFDAVIVYDVTYPMPMEVRLALFHHAYALLAPGGTFVLKDMDPARRLKMRWGNFQERLTAALLRIHIATGHFFQTREEVQQTLEAIGFRDFHARAIDRFYPHPHVLYTARKPLETTHA